jgi:hypothetical protein
MTPQHEEESMVKPFFLFALVPALLVVGVAGAQHPILDMAANKVVQKYQQSSCEQLWEQKLKPKTAQEQEMIQFLRNDAQMRTEFINRIAGPVANKMFECGMIP